MRNMILALALLPVLGTPVPAVAAEPAPPACSSEQAHQFDFWIGDWNVFVGDTLAGTNRIERILDGCVLQENWRGAQGGAGTSLNFYNPDTRKWEQFWVWRKGTTLHLEGGIADGRMILEGDSTGPDGKTVRNRITWSVGDGATVRQVWETSSDGGGTWQVSFDGLYRKREVDSSAD